MARVAQVLSGMPPEVPIAAVNRQCSSGLQVHPTRTRAYVSCRPLSPFPPHQPLLHTPPCRPLPPLPGKFRWVRLILVLAPASSQCP